MQIGGEAEPKDKRPRLSLLPTMHADWYAAVLLGLVAIAAATYLAQDQFSEVSAAVASAQSQREGKATLVVPEASEIVRAFAERQPVAPAATSAAAAPVR